jgi:hypothetical protein
MLFLYMNFRSFADNYLYISFSLAGRPQPNQELCHEQGYIASRSVRTVYLVVVVPYFFLFCCSNVNVRFMIGGMVQSQDYHIR